MIIYQERIDADMSRCVTLFSGDGIGPEITEAMLKVIEALDVDITFEAFEAGLKCYEKTGELIPQAAFDSIERNKIILKAPITTPVGKGFRSINVALRKKYDLYANIRPARALPGIVTPFPNVDIVIFRENTEDLYIGLEEKIDENTVHATKVITRAASERIIKSAFDYAVKQGRKKVTCVHKANILKLSDGLFLDIFNDIKKNYPSIESNDLIVDNTCMQLVMKPEAFDVMVMANLYGDIVSDLCSGLIGGLGLLPSSNLGDNYAMFEAVHGSAPDIAGKNIANPTAFLLSTAMLLDYIEEREAAEKLRKAIFFTLKEGKVLTRDLGGSAGTREFTDYLIKNL